MATLNQRIAMSMLRQCAWVWEHCCMAGEVGSYSIYRIVDSLANGLRKKKDVTGGIVMDFEKCYCWDLFGTKFYPIQGLQSLKEIYPWEWDVTLQIDSFRCRYPLQQVFSYTYHFCKANCPSLMRKTVFRFTEDRECITDLPVINDHTPKPVESKRTLSLRRRRLRVLASDDDFEVD